MPNKDGTDRDYVDGNTRIDHTVIPTMPSGQPVPRPPADPTANPGAAPREDNQHGWGR